MASMRQGVDPTEAAVEGVVIVELDPNDTPLEASQLYTNDFVPTGNEFLPPPAETKKT